MNSNRHSSTSLGVTSLITFFTVLILVSFSLLVTTTAKNDSELSERAAKSVSEYYVADTIAEEKLMELHSIIKETPEAYLNQTLIDNSFTIVSGDAFSEMVIEYKVLVNDIKELQVQISVNMNQPEILNRLSWKTIII